MGKSRLALELARLVEPHFPGGVWTVLLEDVRDASLLLGTVARTLQLRSGGMDGPDDMLGAIQHQLCGRRVLLTLDNFEHVLPAAADVARLIEACEGLHVLVTSRSALRVRAEHELPVAPPQVADDPTAETVQGLQHSAAVQLFVARARAVNPRLEPDEPTLRAIAEICRRLDGLPLAIELAAARARLLAPQQLLRRLEQRFAVLTAGTTDMPGRHQTLRATIDWGYDLLEAVEQTALKRLTVFSGGWTLGAAEDVLTAVDGLGGDVLDALDGLVTKSFATVLTGRGPSPRSACSRRSRSTPASGCVTAPS